MSSETQKSGLTRQLGLFDAIAIYVGIILGSGIFIAPSSVMQVAPGILPAIGLWILGGIIAACGALVYAECGARLPHDGGFYIFYRETFGKALAFIGGWSALLVTYPASLAAIAFIFGAYLTEAIPGLTGFEPLCAAIAIILASIINILGVKTGPLAQKLLTAIKVLVLATVCIVALCSPHKAPSPAVNVSLLDFNGGFTVALTAILGILWTYSGWSDITLVAGELKNPAKNLGRTVLWGTLILIVLYSLVQLSVSTLLPYQTATTSNHVLSDAVQAGLNQPVGKFMALLVVISTFGAINGTILATARLGYAMGRDNVIPRWFAQVDQRFGTPSRAVFGICFFTVSYILFSNFSEILGLFTFSVWIFYALVAISLIILRYRHTGEPLAWRAPLGIIPPLVVLVTAICMTGSLLVEKEQRVHALIGLGLLLIGYPAYLIWRRFNDADT